MASSLNKKELQYDTASLPSLIDIAPTSSVFKPNHRNLLSANGAKLSSEYTRCSQQLFSQLSTGLMTSDLLTEEVLSYIVLRSLSNRRNELSNGINSDHTRQISGGDHRKYDSS